MDKPVSSSVSGIRRKRFPVLRARKALGQHFLVDREILHRILEAAEISPQDVVIEVGPGLGIVTEDLAKRAHQVIAIEIDPKLAAALATNFQGRSEVIIVCDDARDVDVISLLGSREVPYKVVANLPYYAALPILRHFFEADSNLKALVVMLQREVAEAMVARPGSMSLVSIATQFYGSPRIVCDVSPSAFRPSPKVMSAVVRIDVAVEPRVDVPDSRLFFEVVRAGFSAPRKQLGNSLAQGLSRDGVDAKELIRSAGLDPQSRPADVSLEGWAELTRTIATSL